MATETESWQAGALQCVQLMKATLDCKPVAEWNMHHSFKTRLKRIHMDCNWIYSQLAQGLDADNMEEFEDTNAELHTFMKKWFSMTVEERQRVMEKLNLKE
jgi:hypothetical protein